VALQRQVAELYQALRTMEARTDAREAELSDAVRTVREAAANTEVSIRRKYEAALKAKEDALQQCRQELLNLMAAFKELRNVVKSTVTVARIQASS
jgi:hypothetical protein